MVGHQRQHHLPPPHMYSPHGHYNATLPALPHTTSADSDPSTAKPQRKVANPVPSGPSRKQNVACDACRAKKVRCQRTTLAEICAQCAAKNVECTSDYVEQLLSKARTRKPKDDGDRSGPAKRPRAESEAQNGEQAESSNSSAGPSRRASHVTLNHASASLPPRSSLRPSELQFNLLQYLFSPKQLSHALYGYSDQASVDQCQQGTSDLWEEQGGKVWTESPTVAHSSLTEDTIRELADDLVDSFFSFAHPRFTIFNEAAMRFRFEHPEDHPDGPLPHHLLAAIIAFGARFSDHPIIVADRNECVLRDEAKNEDHRVPCAPRSRLVQLLVIRAREVVEVYKTHRTLSLENVKVLYLLESILAQSPFLQNRYNAYNATAVAWQLKALGHHGPDSFASIQDHEQRDIAVHTWWHIYACDGFRAVFHNIPCNWREDEVSIQTSGMSAISGAGTAFKAWHVAASPSSKLCQLMSSTILSVKARISGVRPDHLTSFVDLAEQWRTHHLQNLGVPDKWPQSWNFQTAITAASSDAYYHTLWLIAERTVKEYGIARDAGESQPDALLVACQKLKDEALHSALRITALTSVLALNDYLRVDPLVLYHPIYESGLYLARHGREECMACVEGLRQYAVSYPQFWSQADEIEKIYSARVFAVTDTLVERTWMDAGKEAQGVHDSAQTSQGEARVDAGGVGLRESADAFGMLLDGSKGTMYSNKDMPTALYEWLHQP